MSQTESKKKSLLEHVFGSPLIKLEKNRLEAFLDSVPGAYCGWDLDGGIAWNDDFIRALELKSVESIADIQTCFEPESAAILEGQFRALRESGITFTKILARRGGEKFFRITGRRGKNIAGDDVYDVLWLEDISRDYMDKEQLRAQNDYHKRELKATQDACDTTPFPVWLRNEKLELVWCNQAYAQALSVTPANAIAQQLELTGTIAATDGSAKGGPKDKLDLKAMAEAARDSKAAQNATGHMIISGKRRLFYVQEVPLKHRAGLLGLAQDITREEELRDELTRTATATFDLLAQLRSAIGIFHADHRLVFYNAAFAQLWKLEDFYLNTKPTLGDLMEKLRDQRSLPEQVDFRSFKKSWTDMFTGLIEPFEDMLHLPDGTALRMLAVAHPLGGLMLTFEDVSSRLELESSYNTLIAVQSETLNNLAEGVSVFGSGGRLNLWNPSFASMWGLHPEDLEGHPHITRLIDKMKPVFDAGFWPQYYDQLLSLGLERLERKGRLVRADDRVIDYATLPLADGGMLVTYTDMTDTVQVEQALREKNTALETAERLKLDFLANVSYQLRTPLNSIMGFSEMLEQKMIGDLNDRQVDYAANIRQAGERLLSLINDILDLSTIEAGFMELDKTDVNVAQMLKDLVQLMREWARKDRIDIHLDCPDQLPWAHADERRLKQVILNLLRNAIAFTPADGRGIITVTAEQDGNRLIMSVRDNGVGMNDEEQRRVFEPFERAQSRLVADKTSDMTRGAGLGLSIVRNIIELHGGTIRLASRPHEGTEVTVTLPLGG